MPKVMRHYAKRSTLCPDFSIMRSPNDEEDTGIPLRPRMQEDYDHSYRFIASFIGEHIAYHAKALKAESE